MPIFNIIFNKDQFRNQAIDGRSVKRHYAFVECDECDRVSAGVYPQSSRYCTQFVKPAYWLETKNGKVRASFGLVGVIVFRDFVKLNHEHMLKLGGEMRSHRVNETNFERSTVDNARIMFNHFRSHLDERELDRISREWGELPFGADGWWYYNAQYAGRNPAVMERLRLGGDDENNVIF